MRIKFLIFVFLFSFLINSCSVLLKKETVIIRIKGSDSMLILNQLWAEEYMKTHPNVSIYYSGGGSGEGIKSLINNEVEICAASRPIEPDEVKMLAEKYNSVGMSFIVAKDALSIYINPDNPVSNLTIEQLKKILIGDIINWKDIGGKDDSIKVIIRPPNSGTYLYLKEHVLNGLNYANKAITLPTTRSIVNKVSTAKSYIGYGGIAYSKAVVNCSIEGIAPVLENIQNNKYPLTRYFFFYTVNTPTGEIKNFLDWTLSPEGQEIVKKSGYISLY
jgi:phosphate transport system substrate-binding protein